VTDVQGTVIFDLALLEPAVLPPGRRASTVPLAVSSFRCDDHAVGESSQTFHFRTVVRLGDDEPVSVLRLPGPRLRELAQRLVTRACG